MQHHAGFVHGREPVEVKRHLVEPGGADWAAVLELQLARVSQRLHETPLARELRSSGVMPQRARGLYKRFLLESYSYVRHTSRKFALAASRLGERHRDLRSWMMRHALAEDRHHLMIVRDLAWLGVAADEAEHFQCSSACRGMIGYVYDVCQRRNPVGLLGEAWLLENISMQSADALADGVRTACDLPENAVDFLRQHGRLDVKHVKGLRQALTWISADEDRAAVEECLEVVAELYVQIHLGVTSVPLVLGNNAE